MAGHNSIEVDRWDRKTLHGVLAENKQMRRARRSMAKLSDTGEAAFDDAFFVLHKAVPRLVDDVPPSHRVNRMVAQEFMELSATRRLRIHTMGDPVAASVACTDLAPALQGIFSRLDVEQDLALHAQATSDAAEDAAAQVVKAESAFDQIDPDDADELAAAAAALSSARQELADAEAEATRASDELDQELNHRATQVQVDLQEAADAAAGAMDAAQGTAAAWGMDRKAMSRVDPKARLALAKQLNTPRMREIAELFGRIRNLAWVTAVDADDLPEEIFDVEYGDDLGRLLPVEFLTLGPETENAFFARLADRELAQYAMRGEDEKGRGGIVMCIDESGTMQGRQEMWAKALMLVLLHFARQQDRTMHVVHFSAKGDYRHIEFTEPNHFNPERIIDAASVNFGGGTDFETPMRVALDLLGKEFAEHGRTESDIVFVTDGRDWVDPSFMSHYRSEMERMKARTWGIATDPRVAGGPLAEMSDTVMSVHDLTTGGDVRALLRGVR